MIAPLDYTNLLFAVFYGYFFFGETPPVSVWIGAPLVIAAGLIILWREYRLSQTRAAPVVVPNALAEGYREPAIPPGRQSDPATATSIHS
jgi:hypothetical protein